MIKSVTVVIPVYNGEKYLEAMFRSLLGQTCLPFQILVSDDASTDHSMDIIRRWRRIFKTKNIEVKVFGHKHNVGLSMNVSNMAGYIKGRYVMFADQDDIWKEDKIEKQFFFLEKYPEDMVCICNRTIIDSTGKVVKRQEKDLNVDIRSTGHQDFSQIIGHRTNCPFNAMAVRNKELDIILDIPAKICEQDTYIIVMASTFGKVGFLKENLVYYRIHESNLSGNYYMQMSTNIWKCFWKSVHTNKRFNYKIAVDGSLIGQKLLEKRGISLEDYENGLTGQKPRQIYKDAWKQLVEAIATHQLGAWKKDG